jgi:hypothetical protein
VVDTFTDVHEPTASIDLSLNELDATPGVESRVARELLREVAEAEMAAVWLDELGHAVFRSRSGLRGIGQTTHPVTSRTNLADLAWRSSIDQLRSEVRVPVLPVTSLSGAGYTQTVYQHAEKIKVASKSKVTLFVDLDAVAIDLDTQAARGVFSIGSRIAANTLQDGSGTDVPIFATIAQVGPRRAKVVIVSQSQNAVWVVNSSGDPYLVLRARHQIAQADQPSEWAVAENPGVAGEVLELPANPWIQSTAVGDDLASFLRGETETARPILERVEVLADTRRQLGDIVEITDADVTGMDEVKGVVVGVETSESAGSRAQSLRVRTLPLIIADFNAAWDEANPAATIATFNTEWAGETIADFNLDPLRVP